MNDRRPSALVFAAICGLTACGSDPAPSNPADAGSTADTPASTGDAGTDLGVATDTGATPDLGAPVDSGTPVDAGTPADAGGGADAGTTPDSATPAGAGTCASPINFNTEAMAIGSDLVYRGLTTGMMNNLHPYEGCVERDAVETVLTYRVPAGTGALMFTTEGSTYDTVLYVRNACSQAAGGMDIGCNNDSYDHSPQSTLYVTNAIEGQTLFLVVDGNTGEGTMPSGSFVLTERRVPFGGMGAPCRAVTDPPTARCDGTLVCSEGGSADGTALCVPPVAAGATCDPRGFSNLCATGSSCVTDPAPPEGMMATSVCSLPGTRRGAPCRAAEPRCDGMLACSSADPGTCVPVLGTGLACDPTGEGNRCGAGLTCSALGDGGMPICH